MLSHVLGSEASIRIVVVPEDRCSDNASIPFLLLTPQVLLLRMNSSSMDYPYSMDYPFGLFRLSWLCLLPTSCPPQPTGICEESLGGGRDSLDAVKALLSNSQNIGALSMLFYSQTQYNGLAHNVHR